MNPTLIERAIEKIHDRGATYVYFFNNLRSPVWIEPLWKAGFFRRPPPPIRDGDLISFPVWVESQYLARMAERAPETVTEVIKAMEETENVRVHRDILDAALGLPPRNIAMFVKKLIRILNNTNAMFIHGQVQAIIARLASGNELDAALQVSATVLAFFQDDKVDEKNVLRGTETGAFFSRLEPQPRWRTHDYKEIINRGIRIVLEMAPLRLLKLACDTLDHALKLSYWNDELAVRDGNDNSISWRPAVEEHQQNTDYFHKTLLVPLIRDAAATLLRSKTSEFAEVESIFKQHQWDIFVRILLHLVREFPEAAGPDRITRLLTNPEFFGNPRFQHEWSLLLSEQFGILSNSNQKVILHWIETGFDDRDAKEFYRSNQNVDPPAGLVEKWKKRWQRDKLYFIAHWLSDDLRNRYGQMVAELGEPEHPDFPIWSTGVMSGSTSPKTVDEISGMANEDLIRYLHDWVPSGSWLDDRIEGLASVLELCVKANPDRFLPLIDRFKELRPDYVKALLRGLYDAATRGNATIWRRLLDLSMWVLGQPQGGDFLGGEPRVDSHWRWTRAEIIRLVADSLKAQDGKLPFEYREQVWIILRSLVEDDVPDEAYEQKYSNGQQFGTLSINTTRGQAMHALFTYADWVRRNVNADDRTNPATEILDPLTAHLDIKKDPTFTIRSVYVQHLGWLFHFHRDWLEQNIAQIFPAHPALVRYREVAWQTYVSFCNAWPPLFRLLMSEYERAVNELSRPIGKRTDFDLEHPHNALAQHLMALYWWSEIDFDGDQSLLRKFFTKASDATRAHAIDYVGRTMWNSKEVPTDVVQRLQRLFDWRLNFVKQSKSSLEFEKELLAFGTWISSRKFDSKWVLTVTTDVLKLTVKREGFVWHMMDWLPEISASFPVESSRCLKSLVTSAGVPGFYLNSEKVKQVLKNSLNSSSAEAKALAIEIQDVLLGQGNFEYRNVQ